MSTYSQNAKFSIVELKVALHSLVKQGALDTRVTDLLIQEGAPLDYERQLWDYKLKQPTHTKGQSFSQAEKLVVDREWGNTVKDVVSFYNSYGGYIIFGISDSPRTIAGYEGEFDVDELNKRVSGFTRIPIECSFRVLTISSTADSRRNVGILLIPQRPDADPITIMRKDGPTDSNKKPLFPKGVIFLRKEDSCCRAEEPEDFQFLTSAGRRSLSFATAQPLSTPTLNNNLPPRDPSFIRFVGRQQDTVELWKWFLDAYAPLKLAAGLGGVGKTTLVREFTEDVVRTSPSGIEKVVWLSAKEAVYTAIQGKYHLASRVDFTDVSSLIKAVLRELGEPESSIDELTDQDELLEVLTHNLSLIPAFLVVDDLDSLPLDLQQEAFHCLLQAFTRSSAKSAKPSKCLITARLDLGASPSQLVRIRGLELPDFSQYVKDTAETIDLTLNFGVDSQLMRRFHTTTEGSPTFAAAVLRLMALGDQIENALSRWKGSDGEEVRKFAFERELNNLTDAQIRALYAASVLGECYLDELAAILNSNMAALRDTVSELRKYHLMSSGSGSAQGVSLIVPTSLQLMRDIVRKRVLDPKRIDDECARTRSQSASRSIVASRVTQRVVALWQAEDPKLALEVAQQAVKENPQTGDLLCLLGRAHLRMIPPNYKMAEISFREAQSFNCQRPELLQLWIEAKYGLADWKGLLDITKSNVLQKSTLSEIYIHRATAYQELAKASLSSGQMGAAAEWYKAGGTEINDAFLQGKAVGNVLELKESKSEFLSQYVFIVDGMIRSSDEHLETWLAVRDSFALLVRRPVLLRLGFSRLQSWWLAVAKRGVFDQRALNLVEVQIAEAKKIIAFQKKYDHVSGDELTRFMQETLATIAASVATYNEIGH